jgi:hypothetical protein
MLKCLTGVGVACALAIAAPATSAQPLPFTANSIVKATGVSGTPSCPGSEVVCGAGTSPQFGPFTYNLVFGPGVVNIVSMTFGDGMLVLDETFDQSSVPGNSGNSTASSRSFGHPNIIDSDWIVDTSDSTGIFSGLTGGSGTDILHFAGIAGQGTVSGTLTSSS